MAITKYPLQLVIETDGSGDDLDKWIEAQITNDIVVIFDAPRAMTVWDESNHHTYGTCDVAKAIEEIRNKRNGAR